MKVDPLLILREDYFHIFVALYSILSESSQKNRVFNATKKTKQNKTKEKKRKGRR